MTYDDTFYRYVNGSALESARVMVPLFTSTLTIDSILDVGCGQGAWLSVWNDAGVADHVGVDGAYVNRQALLIDQGRFEAFDLSNDLHLRRRFDLVQCLEVGEHLPADAAARLVASLVRHGEIVLFSAAPRGQGGNDHINEQSYDYWRAKFAAHGYQPYDFVRPRLANDMNVAPWYRYNPILYVSESGAQSLPDIVLRARVAEGVSIADVSPLAYRIRKALVRQLPVAWMNKLAKLKEAYTLSRLQRKGAMP